MNRNIIAQQPPIVIHEKSRENQSKDLAAIIQAASKSNSILSSVWLKRRENHFRMEAPHVGIAGMSGGASMGVIAVLLGASVPFSIGVALFGMMLAAIAIVLLIFQNADTLEYEVNYESTSQQEQSSSRVTYRIETKKGNRSNFVNFPDWFSEPNLRALVNMNNQGEAFNVKTLPKHGVCTKTQYAELRNDLALSQMIAKNKNSWELAPEFFVFADKELISS